MADAVFLQRNKARPKKASVPPPPPPPRRTPVPKTPSPMPPPPPVPESQLPSPKPEQHIRPIERPIVKKPLPQTPLETDIQSSPPPVEIAPQPPPIPDASKPRSTPLQSQPQGDNEERPLVQGRISVWDADAAGVYELQSPPQPTANTRDTQSDPHMTAKDNDAPKLVSTSGQKQRDHEQPVLTGSIGLNVANSTQPVKQDPEIPVVKVLEGTHVPSDTASLAGFRNQLELAFEGKGIVEEDEHPSARSCSPHKASDQGTGTYDVGAGTEEVQSRVEALGASSDAVETAQEGSHQIEHQSVPIASETLSIHSSVEMYDASVRALSLKETSRPPSSQTAERPNPDQVIARGPIDDEMEAEEEGLSILGHQLAAKHDETEGVAVNNVESAAISRKDSAASEAEQDTSRHGKESSIADTASPSEPVSTPQIIMTLSQDEIDGQAGLEVHQPESVVQFPTIPASPSRAPPPPPTRVAPIPVNTFANSPPDEALSRDSGIDFSIASSGRDSSVFEEASTVSSSERSVDNTISTLQKSTSNTTATSIGTEGPIGAREQAQVDLRRLQNELAAAKKRGDSQAAQQSLHKSIEVIQRTYLATATPTAAKKSPILKGRTSFRRISSLVSSSNSSALSDAAIFGDVHSMRALLDAKANPNVRGKSLMTPLMLSACNGHLKCLELLKQRGADEFAVDSKGRNVLHLAVASKRVEVLRWLLTAYPPSRPPQPKHRASILVKATDSLTSRSPKDLREASDAEGSKPLHVAVEKEDEKILNALLRAGVNIESKNNWGRTALHQAIISNRRTSFDVLLQNGASSNVADAGSMSPLHWAAKTGHAEMMQTLLAKGADRHAYDNEGNQPMHQAAWVGQRLGIETLLAERKDLDSLTKQGESLLHIACLNGNIELATYLLQNNVEVNPWAKPPSRLLDSLDEFRVPLTTLTPLHYACCKASFEMVSLLLDHEAWVNAATPEGVTALMMATESEETNIVNLLLSRGAKVNASMPGTLRTALHIAARRGDLETVQQLCRAGANRSARTNASSGNYGRTPQEEAMAKCTDKPKKVAVEEYFATIRQNTYKNTRIREIGERGRTSQPSIDFARPRMTAPSLDVRAAGPITYAPWGQQNGIPIQGAPYGFPQQWSATYPPFVQQVPGPVQYPWYDPNPQTHVESPPPYQPGSNMSARLASQAPVHRPEDPS